MAPGRFVARTPRLQWVFYLLMILCLGVAALWMIGIFTDGPPFPDSARSRKMLIIGWSLVFLCPILVVIALWHLVAAPDELIVVNEEGITSHRLFSEGRMSWADVRSAELVTLFGGTGAKQLRLESRKGKRMSLAGNGTDKTTEEIAAAVGYHLARRRTE